MEDEKGRDEKILGVPVGDPRFDNIESIDDLESHILKEFQHFFEVYKDLEEKKVSIEGWADIKEAVQVIKKAKDNYKNTK
jgi:inorganic pyrophosphatase